MRMREEVLSPAELQVLIDLSSGLTQQEVASKHRKSLSTVKAQAASLRLRLNAQSMAHAVAIAYESGILPVDD